MRGRSAGWVMIKNPFLLSILLLAIESFVLWLKDRKRFKRFFRIIPFVFWIYFLPMLAATAGWIDTASPFFAPVTTHLLPACLFLLLVAVDLKAVARLGRAALIMMGAGSFGIMLGTAAAFVAFRNIVGNHFWSGFGALSGSWTGGSANMVAVKEAVGAPEAVFLPMVVVDTVVPYVWMGLLVAAAAWQDRFDRWTRADRGILDELRARMVPTDTSARQPLRFFPVLFLLGTALAVSRGAQWLAACLPPVSGVFSTYTWTIILVTFLGILASGTPVRRLEDIGASRVGYFILYFVLTSIGARAGLAQAGAIGPLMLAGFMILGIHAVVLLAAARMIRAPLFLAATASQANVGGVASGPIIAEIYQPGFAPVGLLLAIFGNVLGTYLGILTAQVCRALGH